MVMTEAQVRDILDRDFKIEGYIEIQSDMSVNVQGDVRMYRPSPNGIIPIKFGVVDGDFQARNQRLTTLLNVPDSCHNLYVNGNQLTSLEYCPVYLNQLTISYNRITNFEHAPERVDLIKAFGNPFTSLVGFPDEVEQVDIMYDANLPMLRLLNAKSIHVGSPGGGYNHLQPFQPVHDILNRYAGEGKQGAIKAAAELVKAGYKENARW